MNPHHLRRRTEGRNKSSGRALIAKRWNGRGPRRPQGTCHRSQKRAILCLVSGTMYTAKETVRRLLDDLPDNASLEDIQYHIYVREKIERGLRDVEAGRVVDQDEAKRRMAKWLGE